MDIALLPLNIPPAEWKFYILQVDGRSQPLKFSKDPKNSTKIGEIHALIKRVSKYPTYPNQENFKQERTNVWALKTPSLRSYCMRFEAKKAIVISTIDKKPKHNQQTKDINAAEALHASVEDEVEKLLP